MVTEAVWNEWKAGDFTKYLDAVVELFGTGRIMYGSDWPVCTLSSSYMEQYILCVIISLHFQATTA
jgi:L-fuconolactonase